MLYRAMRLQVKLVGSTISCEGVHEFGGLSGRGRHNPHVQSYIVATDQVGTLGSQDTNIQRQL